MKSGPEKLRVLLHEVLPAAGEHCGPSGSEVLSMLRQERQRRRRLRMGAGMLAVFAVVAIALHWNHEPPVAAPVAWTSPGFEPVAIRRVNDEELFRLLEGTDVALLELPNGESRLLVIEDPSTLNR